GLTTSTRWPTATVWLPRDRARDLIGRLTGLAEVYQIDEAPPLEWHNSDSVEPIQANTDSGTPLPTVTPIWDQGLTGAGQIVAVMDSGLDRNEDWFVALDSGSGPSVALTDAESPVPPAIGATFPDRKLHAYWVQPGATAYDNNESCTLFSPPTNFHGTHTSGTVAGDSMTRSTPLDPGYDADDGMAPNAQLLFQDIGNDVTGCLSITDFGASLRQAAAGGASIHSNSWGAPVSGVYNANSAALDEVTWAEQQLLVTVSAGNSGPGLDSIGAPATAKNALTVGALNNGNSLSVAGFSSRGPTDDGRIKPDIQAPGVSIESARGDTNNGPAIDPAATRSLSGTSMSNPTVAGGAALLRQYFTDGF
ncbi:MAG: S8 family serine peptidase, partial [Wenzhouxiangellaceae bacterium]